MLVEFSLKLFYSTCVGKIPKFMEFSFLLNSLIRGIFTHASPTQNSPPSSCYHAPHRGKLLIPPRQHSFENLFSPTAEIDGGNYDLLYQNSVRKSEDDLEY